MSLKIILTYLSYLLPLLLFIIRSKTKTLMAVIQHIFLASPQHIQSKMMSTIIPQYMQAWNDYATIPSTIAATMSFPNPSSATTQDEFERVTSEMPISIAGLQSLSISCNIFFPSSPLQMLVHCNPIITGYCFQCYLCHHSSS